jgi:hypothetical protein
MAYCVTKTTNPGGYQCGCCKCTYEAVEWYDTREEALSQVPLTVTDGLEGIEVKDGATGDVIADVSARFPTGYGRGSGYEATRWYGFTSGDGGVVQIDDVKGSGLV